MALLKLEVGRYRELVFGRVLEQAEDLRRRGVVAEDVARDFRIRSAEVPELQLSALFIRGEIADTDDRIFFRLFPTKDLAKDAVESIRTLVRAINAEAGNDTAGLVTIEIID